MKKKRPLPTTDAEFQAYLKRFIIASLRRATLYWPYRNEALKAARIERGLYQCTMCGPSKLHSKKNVQIDHIKPIVGLKGFTNWEDYFTSMFCKTSNFQVLCKEHHLQKSQSEQIARSTYKKMRKK